MKTALYKTTLIFIFLWINHGCSNSKKLTIPKPDETKAEELPYEIPSSSINLSVSLTWKELSKQVNSLMPIQILEDKEFNEDGLKVHLKKTGDINISYSNNKIQTIVPLNARVWYKYGAFGLYDEKEFRMQGKVHLSSATEFNELALKTITKIERIDWEQNPILVFYGKNVPMGLVIDPIINSQSGKIATAIDNSLKDILDFKPMLKDELQVFRDAILLSQEFNMWLQITPLSLVTSPLVLTKDKILLDVSMSAKMKTTLGKKPQQASKFNNLNFKSDVPRIKETQIELPVETGYEELSGLFSKNLKGLALYEGKKKVYIDSIRLWHSDSKLIIGVQTVGAVSGWIYLRGVPKFNPETSEIYLSELDYHVNTKNVLVKSLNWLMSGKILKLIQENSKYSLKKDLSDLKSELSKQLDGYRPMESILVKFKLNAFDFKEIHLTNSAIVTIFNIQALIKTEIG